MRDDLAEFLRRWGDEVLAAALTTLCLVQIAVEIQTAPRQLADAALGVTLGVAAARRSRDPLPLLGLMLLISLASAARPELHDGVLTSLWLFLLLAIYSAAAHTNGLGALVAGAMVFVMALTTLVSNPWPLGEAMVFNGIVYGAPWFTGRAVRRQRQNDRRLEEEQARAAAAIVAEQARIARELHDVVAHSISVIVIQARGGRRVLETEPGDARSAFDAIERTGEQSLDEMRRLLGMLRRTDEAVSLTPQPSLSGLGLLVEQVEAAGLPVRVTVEGEPRELPPGVDLSAFRIVQEGLTNALKHAGPARAHVRLRYLPDELELEVADDGQGSGDGADSGYGLVGMRERVSVYGGALEAGRRPEGGYALRVRLPIGAVRA